MLLLLLLFFNTGRNWTFTVALCFVKVSSRFGFNFYSKPLNSVFNLTGTFEIELRGFLHAFSIVLFSLFLCILNEFWIFNQCSQIILSIIWLSCFHLTLNSDSMLITSFKWTTHRYQMALSILVPHTTYHWLFSHFLWFISIFSPCVITICLSSRKIWSVSLI